MNIDTDHIHYWMSAIRESKDPIRTLDAFWKGQIKSKEWLIDNLRPLVSKYSSVDIYGGWVGVLASMLFQSSIPIRSIRNIDIDPECENISRTMNKGEELVGKFFAVTADMCDIPSDADVVINTSCEHITQDQYNIWLKGISNNSLLVLQGNNYKIDEHVRISKDLKDFETQCGIDIIWSGELELPLYTRYMVIGNV